MSFFHWLSSDEFFLGKKKAVMKLWGRITVFDLCKSHYWGGTM